MKKKGLLLIFILLILGIGSVFAIPKIFDKQPVKTKEKIEPVIEEPKDKVYTAKFLAAGDALIHKPVRNSGKQSDGTWNYTAQFDMIRDILAEYDIKFYPDNFCRQLKMVDIYRYSIQAVKKYKREGYTPDVIVLQWTQMAFLIGIIKKIYPNAKYIVMEEDVTFLAYRRFYQYYRNPIKKLMFYLMYHVVKYLELKSVCMSDRTVCSNEKDKKLLWETGIDKQKEINIVPYYQNM